jgi:hypothetical protein
MEYWPPTEGEEFSHRNRYGNRGPFSEVTYRAASNVAESP